jgi:hypothetical protein
MITSLVQRFAAECSGGSFFGLPTWYKYLHVDKNSATGKCEVDFTVFDRSTRSFNGDDILRLSLSIIDMLLHVAALVALAFVLYGGLRYITSTGSPDGTKAAQNTIINALVGLVISIVAAGVVAFIGNTIK